MEKFTLELNTPDLSILKDQAKELGFFNERELINALVKDFPNRYITNDINCSQKGKKTKNIYDIPDEHIEFYMKLACRHSTTISGIIFKLVILPKIAEKLVKHQDQTGNA